MADASHHRFPGGCLGRILVQILVAGTIGFTLALVFIVMPQDLRDIGGYLPTSKVLPARNIKAVLKGALDKGYVVTLTETEVNQWLGRELVVKQGGMLADLARLERVWVRLEDGRAEVVMVRRILGRPFTVSMFLKVVQREGPKGVKTEVELQGGPYFDGLAQPVQGGRFGSLVVPQGFLLLVTPAFRKLPDLFHDEIHLGFEEMARISIEKGKLVLNPRDPSSDAPELAQPF